MHVVQSPCSLCTNLQLIASSLVLLLELPPNLDDEVPTRRCLEKGGFVAIHCRSAGAEKTCILKKGGPNFGYGKKEKLNSIL